MIAIIKSAFNIEITDLLEKGCATYLTEQQLPFTIFNCPGAIETVVYANKLIQTFSSQLMQDLPRSGW